MKLRLSTAQPAGTARPRGHRPLRTSPGPVRDASTGCCSRSDTAPAMRSDFYPCPRGCPMRGAPET